MIEEPTTNNTVSWTDGGRSFCVWRPDVLQTDLLPRYFKHNNYSSFVRQLNTYGFRKVNPDRWEFAQENFLRGNKDEMLKIVRKRPAKKEEKPAGALVSGGAGAPPIEVGNFGGFGDELDRLKRDNNVLTRELLRMRSEQMDIRQQMQEMRSRQEQSEQVQTAMMNYAMQDPKLFNMLVQRYQEATGVKDGSRKRRALRPGEEPPQADPGAGSLLLRDQPQSFYDLQQGGGGGVGIGLGVAGGGGAAPAPPLMGMVLEADDAEDSHIMTPAARSFLRQQAGGAAGGSAAGLQDVLDPLALADGMAGMGMGGAAPIDGATASAAGTQQVGTAADLQNLLNPDSRLMSLRSGDVDLFSAILDDGGNVDPLDPPIGGQPMQ
jgi:hypothetical protein